MIEVLCLCILVESAVFGTQMVQRRKEKGTGAGCPDEHLRYFWSLEKFSIVFLVEVYIILMSCRI